MTQPRYPVVVWWFYPRLTYPHFAATVDGFVLGGCECLGTWSAVLNGKTLNTSPGRFSYQYDGEASAKQALIDAMHREIDDLVERAKQFN